MIFVIIWTLIIGVQKQIMAAASKKQTQWLKECFSAWKQTDVAYSRLAHSRNLSLNMVWTFECLSEHPEGVFSFFTKE